MKLFLSFSTDYVLMHDGERDVLVVPYDDLERKLGPALLDYIDGRSVTHLYVLNGPGSFTILRIGCLCINLFLQSLGDAGKMVICRQFSVFDLFASLVDQHHLPSLGFVFMGKRKKGWLVSRQGNEDSVSFEKEALSLDGWSVMECGVNNVQSFVEGKNYWISPVEKHGVVDVLDEGKKVSNLSLDNTRLCLFYDGSKYVVDLSDLGTLCDSLEPGYMMEPTLS